MKKFLNLIFLFFISFMLVSCSKEAAVNKHVKSYTKKHPKKVVTSISNYSNYKEIKPFILNDNQVSLLGRKETSWWTDTKANEERSPEMPKDLTDMLSKYHGYYVGDTGKKEIYLTFDCGYTNEYTSQILDVLKKDNVKASFFATTPCINNSSDIIKRMVNEGHVVGNHSTTHPEPPKSSIAQFAAQSETKFDSEIIGAQDAFERVTGKKMHKFFRPPEGIFSELSLYYTQKLGYRTILWSLAYEDYNTNKQPDPEKAKETILGRTHKGGIFLLHGISKTNAEILDDLINTWKEKGYQFKTLDQLPQ